MPSPDHSTIQQEMHRKRRRRLLATLGAGIAGAYVAPTLFTVGQAHAWHEPARGRGSRASRSRPSYSRPSYSRPSYSRPSHSRVDYSRPSRWRSDDAFEARREFHGRYVYHRTRFSRPSRW